MKQLAKAIISVMKEVKGMEKNSRVGAGTRAAYDGTKDSDVKEAFNNALSKNGLAMIPISIKDEIKVDRWEEESTWNGKTTLKQKQSVFTKVNTKYLLLHESGESIEVAGYGQGVDAQDKGAGKATTYALKNALLYTFLTPVGKIEDTDTTHSNEIQAPTDNRKWLTESQLNATLKATKEQAENVLQTFRMKKVYKEQIVNKFNLK
jgi:hypothetical protein